jgi:hypothetical protein
MKVHPLRRSTRLSRRNSNNFMGSIIKKDKTLTEIENDYFSAWAALRLKILEKTLLLIELTVLAMSMACFEISKLLEADEFASYFLVATMALSAINMLMFVAHVFCQRDFLISKNIYSPMTLVRDTPLLRHGIYNIAVCTLAPNFFLSGPRFTFTISNPDLPADFNLSANDILTIAVIFRFTYFLMLTKNFTSYNSNSSNRICKMVGFKNGVPFLIRTALKHYSLPSMVFLSLYLIFFSAYIFRITEWDNPKYDFTNVFNSCWFVMITYSTVAYGDYLIQGDVSRLIGIPLIFIGLLNTNLIIYVIMTLMGLEGSEKAAFANFQNRQNIDSLNNLRASLLTQLIRLAILRKRKRNIFNHIKWRIQVTKMAQLCRQYKELNQLVHNPSVDLDEGVLAELDIFEQTILANITKLDDIRKIGEAVEEALEGGDLKEAFDHVNTQAIREFY